MYINTYIYLKQQIAKVETTRCNLQQVNMFVVCVTCFNAVAVDFLICGVNCRRILSACLLLLRMYSAKGVALASAFSEWTSFSGLLSL